jgi:hypothetical protein
MIVGEAGPRLCRLTATRAKARRHVATNGARRDRETEFETKLRGDAVDAGRIRRRQRLGGLLNYYCRAAWHVAWRFGRFAGHFALKANKWLLGTGCAAHSDSLFRTGSNDSRINRGIQFFDSLPGGQDVKILGQLSTFNDVVPHFAASFDVFDQLSSLVRCDAPIILRPSSCRSDSDGQVSKALAGVKCTGQQEEGNKQKSWIECDGNL